MATTCAASSTLLALRRGKSEGQGIQENVCVRISTDYEAVHTHVIAYACEFKT